MTSRLLQRLLLAGVVALGVVSGVFLLLHVVPGDPVDVLLGEGASVADRASLRASLGLDAPLVSQWLGFLSGLARGDLGHSLFNRQPVLSLLTERLPATLQLSGAALGLALTLAVPGGLYAASRAGGRADVALDALAALGMSLPSFLLGPLLMVMFAVWLGWLPVAGDGPAGLVLPAVTLGLGLAAPLARMVRVAAGGVLGEHFLRAARARGLSEARILWRHTLANAALPVLTLLGLQLGALLGGAVITEMVFNWPGLGQLALEALQRRDYPLVQGCVLTVALAQVGCALLTDVLTECLDPRVRAA